MKACLDNFFSDPKPTYIRIGKNSCGEIYSKECNIQINKKTINNNSKYALISTSSHSRLIYSLVLGNSFPVDVIDVINFTSESLDYIDLSSYEKILIVEEHLPIGGLFSHISKYAKNLPKKIEHICITNQSPLLTGNRDFYLSINNLDKNSLKRIIEDFVF